MLNAENETASVIEPDGNDFLIVDFSFTFNIFQDDVQKPVWDMKLQYRKPDGSKHGALISGLSEATVIAIHDHLRHRTAYYNSSLPNNGGLRFFK